MTKPWSVLALPSRLRSGSSWFLPAAIALALAVRLLPAAVNFVIGTDEALYLTLGQNLAAGSGFTEDGSTPHTEFAPGYPFFAGLVYRLGGGLELPARLNITLFGPLLVAPVYYLARELTHERSARYAALLTALLPALALSVPNFEAPTEQMYMLFLWGGWLCLWRALDNSADWKSAGLAGAFLGLAHVIRIEGILFIFLGALLLMFRGLRHAKRSFAPASLASASFMLCAAVFALPYALYVHAHTGLWLAPKGLLHQYHGEALRSADPLAFEAAYAEYEHNRAHLSELPGTLEYLWQNRADLPAFYGRNLWTEIRQVFFSVSFLVILWLPFAVWGVLELWKSEKGAAKALFLSLAALPALIYPLSVVDPRYLLPLLPGAMICTAIGLESLPSLSLRRATRNLALPPFVLASSFFLLSLLGPFLVPRPAEYKALGEWMAATGVGQGEVVLARKRQTPFYAGARWEWLPLTDTAGLLTYSAERGAAYFVIDERTVPTLRPELGYLLDPAKAPESLRLVREVTAGGKRALLYRFARDELPVP